VNVTDGMIRFACVARAVEFRPTLPNEVLMERSAFNLEYGSILREPLASAVRRPPVRYEAPAVRPEYRPGLGSCDLMATMRRRPAMQVNERMVELHLGDAA
jgi:hypothetical protein